MPGSFVFAGTSAALGVISDAAAVDDAILLAAGDIARCTSSGDEQTAAILDSEPGTVAASGLFGAASKIAAVT